MTPDPRDTTRRISTWRRNLPHLWHGHNIGCGIFRPSTPAQRRQQSQGVSLIMLLAGRGQLRLDGQPNLPFAPGSCAWVPAGHRLWRLVDRAIIAFINLPPGSDSQIAAITGIAPGSHCWQAPVTCDEIGEEIANSTRVAARSPEHAERTLLPRLLALTLRLLEHGTGEPPAERIASDAHRLLHQLACDPRPLDDLIPDYHAWRVRVRPHLQTSPGQIRLDYRLTTARRLLADPELSIAEIASLCGYTDATAFGRTFRRATGRSPTAWRAQPEPADG